MSDAEPHMHSSSYSSKFYRTNARQDRDGEDYKPALVISEEVLDKLSKDITDNSKNPNDIKRKIVHALSKFSYIRIIPKTIETIPVHFDAINHGFPGYAANAMKEEFKLSFEHVQNTFPKIVKKEHLQIPCKNLKASLLNCLKSNPGESLKCSEIVLGFVNCIDQHQSYNTKDV